MNNQNKHIIDMMKQKNIKYIMIKQFIYFFLINIKIELNKFISLWRNKLTNEIPIPYPLS